MSMRSPLGRARGLGAARSGAGHFWVQRITAIALAPLGLWFAIGVIRLAGADYAAVKAFLGKPWNSSLLILAIIFAIWHGILGIQVVIEDYVHGEAKKWSGLIGIRLLGGFLAVFTTVSILKVAFGG